MIIRSLFILLTLISLTIVLSIPNRGVLDDIEEFFNEKEPVQVDKPSNNQNNVKSAQLSSKDLNLSVIVVNNKNIRKSVRREIAKLGNKANLNHIDTSSVTNMQGLFSKGWGRNFNGDISDWNVEDVENMEYMFRRSKFNSDISKWDVSNVRTMDSMFKTSVFDQDISKWDVSSVKNMKEMFKRSVFDQDISKWDVSRVENMKEMFKRSQFNGDISKWLAPSEYNDGEFALKNTKEMFRLGQFTGNINEWDFSNVIQIEGMFWDSEFDCNNIDPKWLKHTFRNGNFSSCGISNIESHLKSVNTSLWMALIALWGLFLVILWPLISKMEKIRKLENEQKNTNLEHLNISLKQKIGIINMIFSKIRQEESSKVVTKNAEIIEQTLKEMSALSSRVISSKYINTKISELFGYAGLRSKIGGNLNEFIKGNKRLELQLKDSALEAIKIVVDSMTSPSDTSNNLKINIKNVRLNNFKNPANLIFFKEAIEIKISNTGLNNIDAVNQHAEELKLAKEFIELQHYGKFKTNKTGSEVVITLPIKKIEHY